MLHQAKHIVTLGWIGTPKKKAHRIPKTRVRVRYERIASDVGWLEKFHKECAKADQKPRWCGGGIVLDPPLPRRIEQNPITIHQDRGCLGLNWPVEKRGG